MACSLFHEGTVWPEASRISVGQFYPGPLDVPVVCHRCFERYCVAACPTSALSYDEAAEFYKGKTVTIIVPYSPGGGFDQYPRMAQPFLEKYLGANIVVQNVPGAGGITGTNQVYKAKADGLTIVGSGTSAA